MAPSVPEYFPFHSDFTRTFCCENGVSGYKPYYSFKHPLNDFITDINTCGEPRRLINGTKWHMYQPEKYRLDPRGILGLAHEEPLAGWKHKVKLLGDKELGVLQKCIVLVEYFPQSRDQRANRPEIPNTSFGRPYYGRQGQKVWIGRAHAESHESRMRREMEEYVRSLDEPPGIGEAGDRVKTLGEKEQRLLWDWKPANDSEVVQATGEILERSRGGVDGIQEGVLAQSWECTKCSEGKDRAANPRKKWRFVAYYKNIAIIPGPVGQDDDSDSFDCYKNTIPRRK